MRVNILLTVLGALAVGAGCWIVRNPAVVLVAFGVGLVSVGMVRDDGVKP